MWYTIQATRNAGGRVQDMGSRGAMLAGGGFKEYKWEEVGRVGGPDGAKVIRGIGDTTAHSGLPIRSNSPNTVYVKRGIDGSFQQLRIYGPDRAPILDIDHGEHQRVVSLHYHTYEGDRRKKPVMLSPDHALYKKYRHIIQGDV